MDRAIRLRLRIVPEIRPGLAIISFFKFEYAADGSYSYTGSNTAAPAT